MMTQTHEPAPPIMPHADLRYSLWAIAVVALLPAVLLMVLRAGGDDTPDLLSITAGLSPIYLRLAVIYGSVVCVLAGIAGWLCPLRGNAARGLAICAAVMSLAIVPLGTILGLAILVKMQRLAQKPALA